MQRCRRYNALPREATSVTNVRRGHSRKLSCFCLLIIGSTFDVHILCSRLARADGVCEPRETVWAACRACRGRMSKTILDGVAHRGAMCLMPRNTSLQMHVHRHHGHRVRDEHGMNLVTSHKVSARAQQFGGRTDIPLAQRAIANVYAATPRAMPARAA